MRRACVARARRVATGTGVTALSDPGRRPRSPRRPPCAVGRCSSRAARPATASTPAGRRAAARACAASARRRRLLPAHRADAARATRHEPERAEPVYTRRQRRDLIAYIRPAPAGPPIPRVDPARGSIVDGRQAVHRQLRRAAIRSSARAASSPGRDRPGAETQSTPTQIAEAMRIGPYLMPRFSERQLDHATQVDSIARYVTDVGRPAERGGWGIGNIGPIPEGLVASGCWASACSCSCARGIGETRP